MVGVKGVSVLAAAAVASAAIIDLPIIIDNTYSTVEFQIGSPPKPYRLLFDTGSGSAWVVNSDCISNATACPNGSGYDRVGYNASASSASSDVGPYTVIPYLGGDIGGLAVQDAFSTPEAVSPSLTWNQTFLSVNESNWRWITADGFMGMGFASIAENNTSTVVETLLQQGLLDQPRFSIFYGSNLNETSGRPQDGVLTIGGSHEETYVEAAVTYAPLRVESPYQLWRTALRSITVSVQGAADQTVAVAKRQTQDKNTTIAVGFGTAVFDSGAGRVSVPGDVIHSVYAALGWSYEDLLSGKQRFECKDLNSSWAISFTLGDGDSADDVTVWMAGNEFLSPGDQCMPPVDSSGYNGFALIGAPFLQRYYTIFDFGANEVASYQPRIGFGRLKREYDWLYATI